MTPDTQSIADALEIAARKATPGPWTAIEVEECQCDDCEKEPQSHHDYAYVKETLQVDTPDGDCMSKENAVFVALANPSNLLALLAERKLMKEAVNSLMKKWRAGTNSYSGNQHMQSKQDGRDECADDLESALSPTDRSAT